MKNVLEGKKTRNVGFICVTLRAATETCYTNKTRRLLEEITKGSVLLHYILNPPKGTIENDEAFKRFNGLFNVIHEMY